MNITVASGIDLSTTNGYTIRVACLARGLGSKFNVNLISSHPIFPELVLNIDNIKANFTESKLKNGSIINQARRGLEIINLAKKIDKYQNSILQIETSALAGYFSLLGYSNFVVDVHGLYFDELKYNSSSLFSKIHQNIMYKIEKSGMIHARKLIVVSKPMKEYCIENLGIPANKIDIIPNGYFREKIDAYKKIYESSNSLKQIVTFVGLLERWACVDKILYSARYLQNEDILFYIIGDGPDRFRLERLAKEYNLTNVIFTGYLPIDKSYEMMAKSRVLLAPFPKTLALEVACPIKLLEYMALGKPMVVDNVGEIPNILNKFDAALVSNSTDSIEFAENIKILIKDKYLRDRLSFNAMNLSKDYTWERQAEKLKILYEDLDIGR